MERIPQPVFSFLRVSRGTACQMGMVGCGLQLNKEGEYDWSETTITLSSDNEIARCFIVIEGIPHNFLVGSPGRIRIGILQFEEYMRYFTSIKNFLEIYKSRRTLRLGPRRSVVPWELNSHDVFMLRMSEDDFKDCFIADPRGQLTTSEILRGLHLHAPCKLKEVPELSGPPRRGNWIRTSSLA